MVSKNGSGSSREQRSGITIIRATLIRFYNPNNHDNIHLPFSSSLRYLILIITFHSISHASDLINNHLPHLNISALPFQQLAYYRSSHSQPSIHSPKKYSTPNIKSNITPPNTRTHHLPPPTLSPILASHHSPTQPTT